jgi:hypothetical protein
VDQAAAERPVVNLVADELLGQAKHVRALLRSTLAVAVAVAVAVQELPQPGDSQLLPAVPGEWLLACLPPPLPMPPLPVQ